jgi:hypothetical protein
MQRDDKRRKMVGVLKRMGAFTLFTFLREVYGSFYAPAILRRLFIAHDNCWAGTSLHVSGVRVYSYGPDFYLN